MILEGRELGRTYHLGAVPVRALDGLDIRIEPGEFLVLQGPSGSGKTTLINILGLLDRHDRGELRIDGRSVDVIGEDERSDLRRDRFGFVFQTFNLVAVLTAAENVEYPLMLKALGREARRERVTDLLERVGLGEKADVRPDLLSGGERQRVALARALVHAPAVVFADEPTANLDSGTAEVVLDLMDDLSRERGASLVLATHDPRVVARGTRVINLRDGRAVDAR